MTLETEIKLKELILWVACSEYIKADPVTLHNRMNNLITFISEHFDEKL